MVYAKRLIICIILGFITGILCYQGGKYAGVQFTTGMMWGTIFNRTVIGFIIGVSAWRVHWAIHGIVIGLIGTLPMAFGGPEGGSVFILLLFGALWGFLIELFATPIFKAPMKRA